VLVLAQAIYFSHLCFIPALFIWLWVRGRHSQESRNRFTWYMRAFGFLNFLAILVYVLLPVAPPWWISAHAFAQPTTELLLQTSMAAGMDGALVQGMIKTAPQWFAAVPSLHGAYPVLLLLLVLKARSRWMILAVAIYGFAMWAATVVLNQHYIIDLLAGALLAFVARRLAAQRAASDYIEPERAA
jgi:membrane-associated phospholipid phosphatase